MTRLFSWTHNDAELTAELLALLREQGAPAVGNIGERTAILLWHNEHWALTDNGGELIIEKINSTGLSPHVPYTSNAFTMTTMTLVARILAAMRGQQIDYNLRIDYGTEIHA